MKFPHYKQFDNMDCGPTCLKIIAKYYGKDFSLNYLKEKAEVTSEGVSLLGIKRVSELIGFNALSIKVPFEKLDEMPLPCIGFCFGNHFTVIYKITSKNVYTSDPAHGLIKFSKKEFKSEWCTKEEPHENGVLLLIEPSNDFYQTQDEGSSVKYRLKFLYAYLIQYKKYFFQLFLSLLTVSLLSFILAFIPQALVDVGIKQKSIDIVYLILIAQIVLFISQSGSDFIREWILLHINNRLNITLVSDFLMKLMKMPIIFFDSKKIGDIIQRINDHERLQGFLTTTSINVLFSFLNLVVFSLVLFIYNTEIFLVFSIGSTICILWILMFFKKRRDLDYKRFSQLSQNYNMLVQTTMGMHEIKLNGVENRNKVEWQKIQVKLINLNIKSLSLEQYMQAGSLILNQFKNIFIIFLSANGVINGEMTLGMMLSISYIIGQMNAPLDQIILFTQQFQNAKISLDRISEIHLKKDEESTKQKENIVFPESKNITINNLSFKYEGSDVPVLNNININIRYGSKIAIVGTSGGGKTTFLKLLLRFYDPTEGEIIIGANDFRMYSHSAWRKRCGVVLQDGFIFSDSIANNITLNNEKKDKGRLTEAIEAANLGEFVESLPLGYNTKVGTNEHGISQGQKQRILIARAIYKNPEYFFFDEATSALDSKNETIIMKNLEKFYMGRTVIIIAHRLSTVKNADSIIVLDKGKIIEEGNHKMLIKKAGTYFDLVKNQLETSSECN
jgi:ATP-binding cassette, subfamily B, bacterial